MSHLRVSPRILGQMRLDGFCLRCFWWMVQLGFKQPFDRPMPGIMFHLDAFEKRLVRAYIAAHDELPKWLKELNCTEAVEFPAKMTMEFLDLDVTMVGKPDEVFRNGDGRLYLVDYKTAICKGGADPFLPAYETQLLGYAALLEANGIGTVDAAALVYFENMLKDADLDPLDLLTKDGFSVPFRVAIHEVTIDREELKPLVKRLREIADMQFPPEGLEKCKNCALIQKMVDSECSRRSREEIARQRDGLSRANSRELEARRQRARAAWPEQGDDLIPEELDITDSVPGPEDL